jgi:steroid 5-alpha reductase family enzyme
MLDKECRPKYAGYADYIERTSGFIPMPPKKKAAKTTNRGVVGRKAL